MRKILQETNPRLIFLYIFAFAAGGVIQPFLNIYLLEVGLTGVEIGIILGWAALLTVVFTPAIGFIADRFQCHRLAFGIITLIKGFSTALILLSNAWLWLAFMVTLRIITSGASDPLLTPLTFVHLDQMKKRKNLGAIRFWGVAGFSTASLLAGFLAEGRSAGVLFPYATVLAVASLFFLRVLPESIVPKSERAGGNILAIPKPSSSMLKIFFVVFVFSLGFSGPEAFGNVFLAEELGVGNDYIGLVGAMLVLFQLPGFFLADQLNARFGAAKTILIAFAVIAVGWFGFVVVRKPAGILPFIALQGLGRALYLISLYVMLEKLSVSQQTSTNFMLANITLPGLAGMLAKPISGYVYDLFGGKILFLLDVIVLMVVILFTISIGSRAHASESLGSCGKGSPP